MHVLLEIADALLAALNAEDFSQAFTAVRSYRPDFDLPELATLRVSVVPKADTTSAATRTDDFHEVSVDIGVQQRVPQGDRDALDALLTLMQELGDFLKRRRLDGVPAATWVRTANEPVFDPDHLAEKSVFTSVLTVTYRVRR